MALKIWLPLINDTKNIGASDTTITLASGNSFVTSGGKIGNGALKLTARQMLSSTALYGSKQISWAFWVKVNTAWTADWLDSIYWVTSDGSTTDSNRSEFYTNCTKVGMWYKGGSIYGKDYVPGGWAHFAGTVDYETGKAAFYINGVLQGATTNADKTRYVTSVYIGDSGVDICENDVRIYDHILSAAEVKEISKGLVLHYKLNQNFGLTDIIRNQNTYSVYNNFAGSGTTGSITDLSETYQGCPVRRETMTPNDTSLNSFKTGLGSHGVMGHSQTFLANTKYVFWIYYRPVSHTDIQVGGTASNIGGWTAIPSEPVGGGWYRVGQYRSGTVTTDKTDNIFTSFCTPTAVSGSPITIDWAAPHLLSGTTEIPEYDFFMEDKVVDSSGYGNNGTIVGTITQSTDTPRYNCSTSFTASAAINCGAGAKVTDSITVNLWAKYSSWSNITSCTEGGGWNFENNSTPGGIIFPVYVSSIGYVYDNTSGSAPKPADYANEWHMFTGVYDRVNKIQKLFIDGQLMSSKTTTSANPIAYNGGNVIWPNAEATGSNTTASYGNAKLLSDFRIYCTALSAEDILELYNTGAKIDNLNSLHAGELVENDSINVEKSTVVHGSNFDENIIGKYLKYDPNVYIEPDGSAWVRVFHHNNPSAGSFASTNTFTTGAYIDENRWFNVNVCDHLDKWEFMIKGRFTVDGEDWKIRWIQNVNPMVATFAQVAATNTTAITNSRGYTYNAKQWGGLWAKKSSAYLTANNGNEGNWWGAVGSYSVYQGGIPGWGYSGHTPITTTGFNDLYVRIDNVEFIDTIASANKSKIWTANHFIER